MKIKKYAKIAVFTILGLFLCWDIYVRVSQKLEAKVNSYRLEGYNFALKQISETASKSGAVEVFLNNKDGSTTKLNLILQKKK